jgi:hypothetical protein
LVLDTTIAVVLLEGLAVRQDDERDGCPRQRDRRDGPEHRR